MASITASPATTLAVRQSAPRATNWGRYALLSVATVVASVLANVVVFYIGAIVVGYNSGFIILTNPTGVIIFTVVPAIFATLLYAPLLRFTRHADRIFYAISTVVFIVTLIPDFTYIPTVPGATNGQTAILILMHVVAAAVIVGMLTKLSRPQAR
jgi:tryptophan-rich sensory protein